MVEDWIEKVLRDHGFSILWVRLASLEVVAKA